MARSGLSVSLAAFMPIGTNVTLVKLIVSDSAGASPPLLIDQPLTREFSSSSCRYGSGWVVSVLQKSIFTSLPSPAGGRPNDARIRFDEAPLAHYIQNWDKASKGMDMSREEA